MRQLMKIEEMTHPALAVLDWEDGRADVHGIGALVLKDGRTVLRCHCGHDTAAMEDDADALAALVEHALAACAACGGPKPRGNAPRCEPCDAPVMVPAEGEDGESYRLAIAPAEDHCPTCEGTGQTLYRGEVRCYYDEPDYYGECGACGGSGEDATTVVACYPHQALPAGWYWATRAELDRLAAARA